MTLPEDKPKRIFTSTSLKSGISEGKDLILFGSKVYDLTKFSKFHPGGQLAIKHQVGHDSTEIMNAFHPEQVIEKKMPHYYVGEYVGSAAAANKLSSIAADSDEGIEVDHPPHMAQIEGDEVIKKDYLELNKKLRALGYYNSNAFFYAWRWSLFACLLSGAVYLLVNNPGNVALTCVAALMIGFTWHGLSFSAHDAGHNSVTTNRTVDYYLGIFIADFVGGLSIGWWKYNHNTHHIVTNDPEHDPDIQHLPIFAVSARFFDNLYSSFYKRIMKFDGFSRFVVRIQHFLYIPVMTLGRFNLYAHSIQYVLRMDEKDRPQHRLLEIAGLSFFWFWYGYLLVYCTVPTWPLRLLFVYISHASTFILHLQITLSHFAMSTDVIDEESFVEKAVRTTMNVDCPQWFDWFHGGLQFQIEHHMFPRVPRCNFRKVQPLVQEFCKKHNLEYHIYGFLTGNVIVMTALKQVAQQVKFLMDSANPAERFKQT